MLLNMNDGDGRGVYLRLTPPGQPVTDPYLKGTAGSLQHSLWTAKCRFEQRKRLRDGEAVLAQFSNELCMEPAVIDDEAEPPRGQARYAGTRIVRSTASNNEVAILSECRLVPLTGYYSRLFGRGAVLSGDSVYTVRGRVRQSDPLIRR